MFDFKMLLRQLMGGATAVRPQASLLLEARLTNFAGPAPEASRLVGEPVVQDRQIQYRRQDGVAVMTIDGAMASRGTVTDDRYRWQTYEGIQSRLRMAAADPAVHTLLLDLNTPGGYVAGCVETAAMVASVAKDKRVVAFANPLAASAGYWIASAADEICIGASGEVGSIGVLMAHQDWSAFFKMIGVDTTLVKAGDHKTDGNPYEPLSDSVRADFQAEVESLRQVFAGAVGNYRPALGTAGALQTEARMYFGADAVAAGLADRVIDFDSLLAELSKPPTGSRSKPEGATMTSFSQAELDAAVAAARTESHAAGVTEGTASAAKAGNDRISAILASDKVKGKEAAALNLAASSPDMSAEAVIAFVEKNVSASAAKPGIAERMGNQGAALSLGNLTEAPQQTKTGGISAAGIYAARQKAVGAA